MRLWLVALMFVCLAYTVYGQGSDTAADTEDMEDEPVAVPLGDDAMTEAPEAEESEGGEDAAAEPEPTASAHVLTVSFLTLTTSALLTKLF